MVASGFKVLILGGYGMFGGRLAQLLADEHRLTLIIAGRSWTKAQAFCERLAAAAVPAVFDRGGDVERQLRELTPAIMVDASGPFQAYGHDPYRVVRTAIALGINYVDLADDADFVDGVTQLDAQARERGVFALAGVSSFPVLTAAAVRKLAHGMARIDTVIGGIAPSPYADVGLNVIRAITSYAGKPVCMGIGDRRRPVGHALIDSRRFTIAPPGRVPLAPVRFSLVDVPDFKVLPRLWPNLQMIFMGVGPKPAIWHRALSAFAWLVRLRILPSLEPLAPLIHRVIRALRFGEHRGGMFIAVTGMDAGGETIERSWHLLAEGDGGPFVPSMAAEAIIRNCLAGRRPASGARAAANDLELADYEPPFARRNITTGCRQDRPCDERTPLYRRLLDEVWDGLPPALQQMHDFTREHVAEGLAIVDRGAGLLARLIGWAVSLPRAGTDVPVTVVFRADAGGEYWKRTFGERSFGSIQEEGRGRFERLLCERFGPFSLGIALAWDGAHLRLVLRRWAFAGIPMPPALAPRLNAYESVENGRFHFHVEIGHALTGLIVRYRGWLVPRVVD